MDKEKARHTLFVAYEAYSKLVGLVPETIPYVHNYMERDDIDARLYKGIFSAAHVIIEEIHNNIIEVHPELDDELVKRFERLQ